MKEFIFRNHNIDLEKRLNDLVAQLTLEEKIYLIPTNQSAVERLGIGEYIIGGEAAHGIAWLGKATSFPQPIGLSNSWDIDLMYRIGEAIGNEARVFYQKHNKKKGLTLWAPTVDLERNPLWGRTEEGYGEDPFLTGKIGRALVNGMQGNHSFYKRTLSTIKHYMGNNNEKNRLFSSSNIDNRNKFEYYIRPFKYLIENNGAFSVMPAYNSINGLPCNIDPDLKNILKNKWGLQGYIVGDAGDMKMTVDFHKYCSTYAEAVSLSIKNGVDSINDEVDTVVTAIKEALQTNLLTELDLDLAIKNIFRGRMLLGEFDPEELNPYSKISEEILCSETHCELSFEAAKKSIVLLKNSEKKLPLNKKNINSLGVIGPLSNNLFRDWYSGEFPYCISPLQGIRNQFDKEIVYHSGSNLIAIKSRNTGKYLSVNANSGEINVLSDNITENEIFETTDWGWDKTTLISKINNKYVSFNKNLTATADEAFGWFVKEAFIFVEFENGYKIKTWNNRYLSVRNEQITYKRFEELSNKEDEFFEIVIISNGVEEAKKLCEKCDTVVIFVGNHPLINGKEDEDRPGLSLPESQIRLINNIRQVNRNIIICIIGSYPFSIPDIKNYQAILYSSHGSQELGNALAEAIFGGYSPSGRLTLTWYRDEAQLKDIMEYDIMKVERTYLYFKEKPLYSFGHGLSYTSFLYTNMFLQLAEESNIEINFDLSNEGLVSSDEVVQVYFKCNSKRIIRPLKELKAFERIYLTQGEVRKMNFKISLKDLTYWDVHQEKYCIESAIYTVMIGSSSEDIRLTKDIKIVGDSTQVRNLEKKTKAENYDSYNNCRINRSIDGSQIIYSECNNSWVMFSSVILKKNSCIEIFAQSSSDGVLEIRKESPKGEILGTIQILGGWRTYEVNLDTTIEHHEINLLIVMSKGISLDWIRTRLNSTDSLLKQGV